MATFEVEAEAFCFVVLGIDENVFFEGYVALFDFVRRIACGRCYGLG